LLGRHVKSLTAKDAKDASRPYAAFDQGQQYLRACRVGQQAGDTGDATGLVHISALREI
jgi:hypothetical protein